MSVSFSVEESVEEFTSETRGNLTAELIDVLECQPLFCELELSLTPASVHVVALLTIPNTDAVAEAQAASDEIAQRAHNLTALELEVVSDLLGVNVSSPIAVTILHNASTIIAVAPPPSPLPPPQVPEDDGPIDGLDSSALKNAKDASPTMLVVGVAVGGALVLAACLAFLRRQLFPRRCATTPTTAKEKEKEKEKEINDTIAAEVPRPGSPDRKPRIPLDETPPPKASERKSRPESMPRHLAELDADMDLSPTNEEVADLFAGRLSPLALASPRAKVVLGGSPRGFPRGLPRDGLAASHPDANGKLKPLALVSPREQVVLPGSPREADLKRLKPLSLVSPRPQIVFAGRPPLRSESTLSDNSTDTIGTSNSTATPATGTSESSCVRVGGIDVDLRMRGAPTPKLRPDPRVPPLQMGRRAAEPSISMTPGMAPSDATVAASPRVARLASMLSPRGQARCLVKPSSKPGSPRPVAPASAALAPEKARMRRPPPPPPRRLPTEQGGTRIVPPGSAQKERLERARAGGPMSAQGAAGPSAALQRARVGAILEASPMPQELRAWKGERAYSPGKTEELDVDISLANLEDEGTSAEATPAAAQAPNTFDTRVDGQVVQRPDNTACAPRLRIPTGLRPGSAAKSPGRTPGRTPRTPGRTPRTPGRSPGRKSPSAPVVPLWSEDSPAIVRERDGSTPGNPGGRADADIFDADAPLAMPAARKPEVPAAVPPLALPPLPRDPPMPLLPLTLGGTLGGNNSSRCCGSSCGVNGRPRPLPLVPRLPDHRRGSPSIPSPSPSAPATTFSDPSHSDRSCLNSARPPSSLGMSSARCDAMLSARMPLSARIYGDLLLSDRSYLNRPVSTPSSSNDFGGDFMDDDATADEAGERPNDANADALDSARSWLSDAEIELAEWAASTPRPDPDAAVKADVNRQFEDWLKASPRLHHSGSSVHHDGSSSAPTSARHSNDGSSSARSNGSCSARHAGSSSARGRRVSHVFRNKSREWQGGLRPSSPTSSPVSSNSPLAMWFKRRQEEASASAPAGAISEDPWEEYHAAHPELHVDEDGSVFL